MTLSSEEFLRRFLVHVLPKSFVKIRHYGLLAHRRREQRLATCRRLLTPLTATGGEKNAAKTDAAVDPAVDAADAPRCPCCGGCRFRYFELPPERGAPTGADTS